MKTILVTGATGFLGSHIVEELISQGFKIYALRRKTSNLWRCNSFKNRIQWINCDDIEVAGPEIITCTPDILIHVAWNGVKASDRDRWVMQEENLSFFASILEIVKKTKLSKIIALGSQAEYGRLEGIADETYPCKPISAYGANKVCVSILLKSFAEQNKIDWYWLRIFSVFGPKEEKNWLIPATIKNLLEKKEMALTPCEQQYDYLFIKDFVAGVISVIHNKKNNSGVYNLSSGERVKLKDILLFLENKLSPNRSILKFGALNYRGNQVMHMQGNSDLFFKSFNFKPNYSVYEGLEETINYYKLQKDND